MIIIKTIQHIPRALVYNCEADYETIMSDIYLIKVKFIFGPRINNKCMHNACTFPYRFKTQ